MASTTVAVELIVDEFSLKNASALDKSEAKESVSGLKLVEGDGDSVEPVGIIPILLKYASALDNRRSRESAVEMVDVVVVVAEDVFVGEVDFVGE